ncbi:MAG: L-serine ammonia-lyase, partial [Planctomycetota bacterium]
VFDLFTIGIGPSSSHTVGPMRAARMFVQRLQTHQVLDQTVRVRVDLYGSLGATGRGHGTDKAVIAGLSGIAPEKADPDHLFQLVDSVRANSRLKLGGDREISWTEAEDLGFQRKTLPYHSNGMTFQALSAAGEVLLQRTYYSIGGGFVVNEQAAEANQIVADSTKLPFPFTTAAQLLTHCREQGLSISSVMWANEQAWRTKAEIQSGLLEIWDVMQRCVERGCHNEGILPGGLKVKRRAASLFRKLQSDPQSHAGVGIMDWVNCWAIAVNEENAAGGQVVTAPTNGAAGIIPAVMHYYHRFCHAANPEGMVRFLLTAAAIGILFKENASISGAEVGCQGEVGSACSMAAAGLTEVLGGTPEQVENAAEIGMEHNLGLTCDPIGGLVQVPCIERNAMAAVKAINASRLALRGDGKHFVSLDKVIKTMRDTGRDMKSKYKETARGGLAVNVIEC